MARKKSSPEAYHSFPPGAHPASHSTSSTTSMASESAPAPAPAPAPHDSPSTTSTSHSTPNTCPTCSSVFSDNQTKEFRDHVAGCTIPGTPDSGSSLSSLSSQSPEPFIGLGTDTSENAPSNSQSLVPSRRASAESKANPPSQPGSNHPGPEPSAIETGEVHTETTETTETTEATEATETTAGSVPHSPARTHQSDVHEDTPDVKLSQSDNDDLDHLITPYALPIQYEYEYYDEVEDGQAPPVANPSDAGEGESTVVNSPNSAAVMDERPVLDSDTSFLEQQDPFQTAPPLSRNNSGMSATPSSPGDQNLSNGLNTVDSSVIGTPGPSQKARGPNSVANPVASFSLKFPIPSAPPSILLPSKPKQKRLAFKKLGSLENFEKYLANPEKMSYGVLYLRTARVSESLVEWQTEFDAIDAELKSFELQRRTRKKITDEEAKEEREKQQREDDGLLLALHRKFSKELKYTGPEWRNFVAETLGRQGDLEAQRHFDLLKSLRNAATIAGVQKRQAQALKKKEKPNEYDNLLLPKLTKEDTESYFFKRKITIDPQIFEDKKQADVLSFAWSKDKDQIGKQRPKVRRGENPFGIPNVKGNVAMGQENGRPQRTRGKRAIYDTDQGEDVIEEGNEELPTKRKRTQRTLNGASADVSAQATREPTPAVKTFASGKRVGRPPGSKTKPKIPKSKLQSVQVPPESATPEGDQVLGEPAADLNSPKKKTKQALAPNEEAQLQDAAESLVNKTIADQTEPPVKRKHPGGRPKKAVTGSSAGHAYTRLGAPGDLTVKHYNPHTQNKGGRPKKSRPLEGQLILNFDKPKTAKGGRGKKEAGARKNQVQLEEDDDVLPSTEQDDESPYASVSTSRPTTSSSNESTSTLGIGRAARVTAREKSKTRDINGEKAETTAKKGRGGGKRKRGSNETTQSNIPEEAASSATKKRKTRGENSQESVQTAITEDSQAVAGGSATGRSKRKRAIGSYAEPAEEPEFDIEDDDPIPPPKKRKIRLTKKVSSGKGKAIKDAETSDEAEIFEDGFAPPPKKRPARKAAPKTLKIEFEEFSTPEVEEERVWGSAPATVPVKTPVTSARKGRKGKSKSVNPPADTFPQQAATEGEAAIIDEKEAELLRKKAQKSAKLSASAKRRWESGQMVGPMQKRKATNDAKKAARAAAKANAAVTGSGPAPPQPIAPAPLAAMPEDLMVGPASVSTTPALPRASGRARKPSRLALGMDGAFDDDDEDEGDTAQFKSEYEQFRALSSPKDPMVLGKRVRKSIYDLSAMIDEDEDADVVDDDEEEEEEEEEEGEEEEEDM